VAGEHGHPIADLLKAATGAGLIAIANDIPFDAQS
jgi:hypothetical protein